MRDTNLIWRPAPEYAEGHLRALTSRGGVLIGPRKSDGCWEFLPAGKCWHGVDDAWTLEECLRQVHLWIAEDKPDE